MSKNSIETLSQFHQHFTRSFSANLLAPKTFNLNLNCKSKLDALLTFEEKDARKMLVKLTPKMSISMRQKHLKLNCTYRKAARKKLVKLTPKLGRSSLRPADS